MIRVRQIVLIAGVVASLSALTLGSASAATGKTVDSSRFTVNVNNEVGAGEDVWVSLSADTPIVAKRPLYLSTDPGLGTTVDVYR